MNKDIQVNLFNFAKVIKKMYTRTNLQHNLFFIKICSHKLNLSVPSILKWPERKNVLYKHRDRRRPILLDTVIKCMFISSKYCGKILNVLLRVEV